MYKHIFFDLDRTLWHFEANSQEVLSDMFNKFDITTLACISFDDFITKYREINHGLWDKYREGEVSKNFLSTERFDATLRYFEINNYEMAKEMGDFYLLESPYKKQLFPYTIELLDELSKKYKMHIITNGFVEVQYTKLEQSDLRKYFDKIIISEETKWKKPNPNIFHYSMEQAGATLEESIMIGDDLKADIKGAASVGMDQIWVNFDETYAGFKPTYTVSSLKQILDIL